MKGDRWEPLRAEAIPKARRFAKSWPPKDREIVEAAYLRGYLAGATRDERRGLSAKKCNCGPDAGCYRCYTGPVTDISALQSAGDT